MTLCFILTKWYVNITLVVMVICGLMGFILTKWYVNKRKYSFVSYTDYPFYIN